MSNTTLPSLSVADVINATVEAFNATGHRFPGSVRKMTMQPADITSAQPVYSEVRPYSIYRDACIALCEMIVDDDMETIHAAFPGTVKPADASARAHRNLKSGNEHYTRLHNKLVTALLPREEQLNYYSVNFLEVRNIVDPEANVSRPVETTEAPVTKNGRISVLSMNRERLYTKKDSSFATTGNIPRDTKTQNTPALKPAAPVTTPPELQDRYPSRMPVNINNIQQACVNAWNEINHGVVRVSDIHTNSQRGDIRSVRQLSIYVCRRLIEEKDASFAKLADTHGNRSDASAMSAFNTTSRRVKGTDPVIKIILRKVLSRLDHSTEGQEMVMNPLIDKNGPKYGQW